MYKIITKTDWANLKSENRGQSFSTLTNSNHDLCCFCNKEKSNIFFSIELSLLAILITPHNYNFYNYDKIKDYQIFLSFCSENCFNLFILSQD